MKCDRCKQEVGGAVFATFSEGVYVVNAGAWAKYANPGETIVCDNCMWADARYKADHGDSVPYRKTS